MAKKCSEKLIFGSNIAGSVGWGLFGVSLIVVILLALLKAFEIIVIPDLYFWISVISSVAGATTGIIGSSIFDACNREEKVENKPM